MTELIRELYNLTQRHTGCVVTIGNFDGVHRGHLQVLNFLKQIAAQLALPSLVIIFEPQPLEFFIPHTAPPRLTRWQEKFFLLAQAKIDKVLVIRFTAWLAALRAKQFVTDILHDRLGVRQMVIGEDFKFGHAKEGDVALLQTLGQELEMAVTIVPPLKINGKRISSTGIRQLLAEGNLEQAETLLGGPYFMIGRIVYGNQLGRQLGFPTANIYLHRTATPLVGIYAVRLYGIDAKILPGVAYIGTRPTIHGTRTVLEVHLFNFDKNIYGKKVRVEFCKKIRDDKKFASLELLKQQISHDVKEARNYFFLSSTPGSGEE